MPNALDIAAVKSFLWIFILGGASLVVLTLSILYLKERKSKIQKSIDWLAKDALCRQQDMRYVNTFIERTEHRLYEIESELDKEKELPRWINPYEL